MFREEYYPYGETAFGSYSKKRYRFAGKELDESTGLYHFGARYYRPWTARFVSVDPLATKTPNFSSYHYANCNPIGNIDVMGLSSKSVHGKGGNGGGGASSDAGAAAADAAGQAGKHGGGANGPLSGDNAYSYSDPSASTSTPDNDSYQAGSKVAYVANSSVDSISQSGSIENMIWPEVRSPSVSNFHNDQYVPPTYAQQDNTAADVYVDPLESGTHSTSTAATKVADRLSQEVWNKRNQPYVNENPHVFNEDYAWVEPMYPESALTLDPIVITTQRSKSNTLDKGYPKSLGDWKGIANAAVGVGFERLKVLSVATAKNTLRRFSAKRAIGKFGNFFALYAGYTVYNQWSNDEIPTWFALYEILKIAIASTGLWSALAILIVEIIEWLIVYAIDHDPFGDYQGTGRNWQDRTPEKLKSFHGRSLPPGTQKW